jgi:hypothetical protein
MRKKEKKKKRECISRTLASNRLLLAALTRCHGDAEMAGCNDLMIFSFSTPFL